MNISILTCVLGEPLSLLQTFASIRPLLSSRISWTIKFASNTSTSFIKQFERTGVNCIQSEDISIYDAMNQALKNLNSNYYFVVGAGDEVDASGLSELESTLTKIDSIAAIFCPIILMRHGFILEPNPNELHIRMACPHPGSVLKVDNSLNITGFNTSYQIAADYDHICRYVHQFGTGITTKTPLVKFAGGGMSEVRSFEGSLEEELIRIRIWKAHEYSVHARLLRRSTNIASSLFDQVANLHSI